LSNIKNNYSESIKRKVDQEHIKKPPTIKVRLNKNRHVSILSSELNSTTLLIFAFIRYRFAVYKYKKSIHNKWLLNFDHVFFMYIQCCHN